MNFANRRRPNNRREQDKKIRWDSRFAQNQIKVIGSDDKIIGVMTIAEALQIAKEQKLDLVEISSNTSPPVCKILDYGKYKYDTQKEANLKRKKNKSITLKEIQLRHNIGTGDLETKLKKARQFLSENNKIKIAVRLRGREMTNKNLAINILKKVVQDLSDVSKLEKELVQNNNNFFLIIAPC